MRRGMPLFTKILLWFFVNVLVLAAVFLVVFNLRLGVAPDSPIAGAFGGRFETVAGRLADEMQSVQPIERTAVLERYSASYRVTFLLYDSDRRLGQVGRQLAGVATVLPDAVARRLADPMPPGPPSGRDWPPPSAGREEPPPMPSPGVAPPPRPRPRPVFTVATTNPKRYWAGVRLLILDPGQARPTRATLIAFSDSMSGHGLFFDPTPLLLVVGVVLVLSILLWLPFVRGLTTRIEQMTRAAEHIAEERFDVRVNERRSDELGRLGAAINHLAARLDGFVGGQKRFLGDISHELNSPLARLQVALGILEERVDPAQAGYVADAQEEVRLMSGLISEVLTFARAGLKAPEIGLTSVPLLPLVRRVCAREMPACDVKIAAADDLQVLGHPDLLDRAFANVLRNSARYAARSGPIVVAAERRGDAVVVSVVDHGPGVPPEAIARLFDPFFRLEPDRARATGGTGLGLAIVKACVEACNGSVSAHSAEPSGLEVRMVLKAGG